MVSKAPALAKNAITAVATVAKPEAMAVLS